MSGLLWSSAKLSALVRLDSASPVGSDISSEMVSSISETICSTDGYIPGLYCENRNTLPVNHQPFSCGSPPLCMPSLQKLAQQTGCICPCELSSCMC